MRFSIAAAAAAAVWAVSSAAQAATLSVGSATVTGINDFSTQLEGAFGGAANLGFGLLNGITFDGPVELTFSAVAAESGYDNTFDLGAYGSLFENEDFAVADFLTETLASLTAYFPAGALGSDGFEYTSTGKKSASAGLASPGLGVFFDATASSHSVFFLAYDDQFGQPDDDDFDDFIVRVNVAAVPVPAAGLLLGSVLAGAGVFARRRRQPRAA